MFVLMDGEEFRQCGRCHELKPIEQFNWRRRERGQRDNMCRPCRAAYKREHYLKKSSATSIRLTPEKALYLERTEYLLEYSHEHPCVDCGERDPLSSSSTTSRTRSSTIAEGLLAVAGRDSRRDRKVRGRVSQLPSAARITTHRGAALPADEAPVASGRRDSNPLPRAWKAHVQPVTPRPRGLDHRTRARPWTRDSTLVS